MCRQPKTPPRRSDEALPARDDGDQQGGLLELATRFFAVAERDIDRAEMHAKLAFGLDRAGALVALFDPYLLGEEDPVGQIRAIPDFGAPAFASALLADQRSVSEIVERPPLLRLAGIAEPGAGLGAEPFAADKTGRRAAVECGRFGAERPVAALQKLAADREAQRLAVELAEIRIGDGFGLGGQRPAVADPIFAVEIGAPAFGPIERIPGDQRAAILVALGLRPGRSFGGAGDRRGCQDLSDEPPHGRTP